MIAQLLCTARTALRQMPFFGMTEYLDASICLLFHTFGWRNLFRECCVAPAPAPAPSAGAAAAGGGSVVAMIVAPDGGGAGGAALSPSRDTGRCALLRIRASLHSAKDRAKIPPPPR